MGVTFMQARSRGFLPESSGARSDRGRVLAFLVLALVLVAGFFPPLAAAASQAYATELHSHILLIPFVSAYLLHLRRKDLASTLTTSSSLALAFGVLAAVFFLVPAGEAQDILALRVASFVTLLVAACFLCFGKQWAKSAAFPLAFLFFLVPIPSPLLGAVEDLLTAGSAEAAGLLFKLSGTPVFQDGQTLQIPGIVLEVARECSGIRSTLVLFITSLVASQLILKSPWRRTLLVAAVLPLGILRNGFRILVIGLLCVHQGPQMIDSVIHRKGGPVFFAISLIPLFLLAWWLRRGESLKRQPEKSRPVGRGMVTADTTPGTSGV